MLAEEIERETIAKNGVEETNLSKISEGANFSILKGLCLRQRFGCLPDGAFFFSPPSLP